MGALPHLGARLSVTTAFPAASPSISRGALSHPSSPSTHTHLAQQREAADSAGRVWTSSSTQGWGGGGKSRQQGLQPASLTHPTEPPGLLLTRVAALQASWHRHTTSGKGSHKQRAGARNRGVCGGQGADLLFQALLALRAAPCLVEKYHTY
uniref:Uncharacterized protein n=1 Tax=Pipistrellus kuhlii TaxID=59472 RepID=A0A7J7TW45_PIPKU|nr:hypothetical protein mPipKuh1_009280 [Pipistrellus kuhlii]